MSVTVDAMRTQMPAFCHDTLPRLMQLTGQAQDLAMETGLTR
ncbi:hypothetical protein [Bradyrhizobium sp. 199]|nr:hypothetical protein [Bradyrhizobium sp. 199]